jgi:hypothetical protein
MHKSIHSRVLRKILGKGRGWVFTPHDFADMGADAAVRMALSRLKADGVIMLASRGIYYYPVMHDRLGALPPSLDGIRQAIQRRDGTTSVPDGAQAANMLGLSDQVPVKQVLLTSGPSRTIRVGRRVLVMKHAKSRSLRASATGGLVIQALRYMGKDAVSDDVIARLRGSLPLVARRNLAKDARFAPAWVAKHLVALAE